MLSQTASVDSLRDRVERLLFGTDNSRAVTLHPLRAGGNNRVFLARALKRSYLVKHYYSSSEDKRDRLGAEWGFLSYAEKIGIDCVPKPVCCDRAARIGIMEFVQGRTVCPDDVGKSLVDQAANFFLRLNGQHRFDLGGGLPSASEACFGIESQCDLVGHRVQRLERIQADDPEGRAAAQLALDIKRRFEEVRCSVLSDSQTDADSVAEPMPAEYHCISPSDFGFHNALLDPDGAVVFLDFEYAGWDDPAKMAADFFCHRGVPVDTSYFERFMKRCFRYVPRPEQLVARTRLLLPLFRLKWCCIMLNEFLSDAGRRRIFANPLTSSSRWRRGQVNKVGAYLEHV